MRELLKRVLNARTIGYPLPPSIVKEIEAELAKPEHVSCNFEQREGRCDGFLWDQCTVCGSVDKNQCKKAKPEPEPERDYRRVLKEINEFIKADMPEEIKAELAKPEPEPVAWMYDWSDGLSSQPVIDNLTSLRHKTSHIFSFNVRPLYTHPPAQKKPLSECTNSDIWNCKYCNKTKYCAALNDGRNFMPAKQKPLSNQERQRLETLERVCEGLRQDTIDGGFNFKDFGKYARDLEEKNKAMTAKLQRVAALEFQIGEEI